jgi:uridylate kinase
MAKKIIVLSLGGSVIVPDNFDVGFLRKFKKVIKENYRKYKFVIVCGGGNIARRYIEALRAAGLPEIALSMAGISVTRLNARFMTYFFGKDANEGIPHDMKHVENLLTKNDVVFCGALRYASNETSDGTAAKLAAYFKTNFVNITNVSGLYTKNPLIFKDAKFIPKTSWKEFFYRVRKIKFKPGQHFVLDQHAARIIRDKRVKTYIIGKDLKNLNNLLNGKKFKGTLISG